MKYQYKNFQQLMLLRLLRLQKYSHEEAGFVLVIVISMLLILTSLLAAYALVSKVEKASNKAYVVSNDGFYAAEAGLNLRAKQVQDKFSGYKRPSGTSPSSWKSCLDITANQGSDDFKCETFKDQNGNETFNNQKLLSYVQENPNNPIPIQIGAGEPFAGLNAQEYRYDVTSVAVNSQNLPSAILGMRFKSRLVPMFQFVAFYNNDAEFTNPPNMTLSGPIHSNGDLYLNASSSATLTINGLVSTVGKLYRGEKADTTCGGTVRIYDSPSTTRNLSCGSGRREYTQSQVSAWNDNIRVSIPKLVVPPPEDLDPTPGELYWDKADLRVVLKLNASGNPSGIEIRNQDNSVDTTKTTALLNSCPSNTAATTTLTANAVNGGITLNVNSTNGFTAMAPGVIGDAVRVGTDYDSNVITNVNAAAKTITLKRLLGSTASTSATLSKMTVWTSDTFYNYREKNASPAVGTDGSYIRMLNVDVQGLLDCIHAQTLMPGKTLADDTDGGLVWFLTVDGPQSKIDTSLATTPANTHNNYAVRLYNGKYLYSGQPGAPEIKGLTIVSDQAVYVQGDYNLKDNAIAGVTADNPATASVTERWRPAAILADTINILSNSWKIDDSNGRTYVGSVPSTTIDYTSRPAPLPTSVNAAFLAGTTITGSVNGTTGQNLGASTNSGGINNYPRFQENWASTVPFWYKGSFVSLNPPRRTNSPFCGSANPTTCNIYTPPVRNWDYDTDFNNAANLPPLTPRFVYLRQEVFSRNFDQ